MADLKPYFSTSSARRNAKRRAEYAADPAHAENLRRARRATYRKEHGEPLVPDPRNRLDQIGRLCSEREVFDASGRPLGMRLCCTVSELCDVLGQRGKTVDRWISSERFPEAAYSIAPSRNQHGARVFLSEEVEAVAEVLSDHFSLVAVLRADHAGTIDRLQGAVDKVRKRGKP